MTTTKHQPLTSSDLDRAARDERWLGFGYLGERARAAEGSDLTAAAVDAAVIAIANSKQWTYEELFAWANSKDGRWFGDALFGGAGSIEDRVAQARGWGVI